MSDLRHMKCVACRQGEPTLTDNENLQKVISHYTILKKHTPIFLKDCGFSGAVGALLNITGQ